MPILFFAFIYIVKDQTIIDFTLLSKETNEERHLKYQVTVNEDLAVNYEEIN